MVAMEVQSASTERSRELADLRRRAYGPDADIARDPDALARLHELERREREDRQDRPASPEPSPEPPVAEPPSEPPADASATGGEPSAAEPAALPPAYRTPEPSSSPSPSRTTTSAWWRRIPIWLIALASAVLGALIALSAVNLAADRPDATLAASTSEPTAPDDWDDQLRGWDLDPSTTRSFGAFRQIDVWAVRSRIGAPCVLLSSRGRPFALGCASQDLDPVVDFTVQSGMLGILNDQLRDGTLLRFVARDDRVDVWVRESPARETQSIRSSSQD